MDQLLEDSCSLSRVLAQIDIISSNSMIEAFWRQLKHAWLLLNTLDSTVAVRGLVAFYVREHNEKIPRAVLRARTPDEVYFGREENLLERLSEHRKRAQRVRSTANRAASCHRCEPSHGKTHATNSSIGSSSGFVRKPVGHDLNPTVSLVRHQMMARPGKQMHLCARDPEEVRQAPLDFGARLAPHQ